jgi:hypothetical protein
VATRVYTSGFAGRTASLIGGIIAVPLVAIAVPLVLLQQILGIRDSEVLIGVCIAIAVVGGLWLLAHVFVTGVVRFETDAQTVRLRRGLRVTNEWQRAGTVFTSLVERQSYNGIPTGATRTVYATTAHKRTEVLARWFGAAVFSDLMADLAPVRDEQQPPPAAGSRTFTLTPGKGARGPFATVLLAVLVGALAATAYFLFTDVGELEAVIVIGSAALLAVVVAAVALGAARRRVARTPSSITVTGSTIQVGSQVLYFGQLASIEVTPPSYSGSRRTLELVEKIGTRTSYLLGTAGAAGASAFPEYAEFVELLGRVAPAGAVRFDLR